MQFSASIPIYIQVMGDMKRDMAAGALPAGGRVDSGRALAARYGVQSIPTVMVFKNGQTLATLVGVRPYDAYTKEIDQAL